MINVIVIDDEKLVRSDIIDRLTSNFPKEITIVSEASSVAEAKIEIEKYNPDLLLLDVDLGDGTGFDVLKQIRNKNIQVIFITGFDTHAIKAIKVGALDYILKPVDDEEFKTAVKKAINNMSSDNNIEQLIKVSNDYYNGLNKRIILRTSNTVFAINEDDILYCKSDGNYTTFYTILSEKIVVSKSMMKIEELLSESTFVRCHQSYIVNKNKVVKYQKQGFLILKTGDKIPVAARRKEYTLQKIF
ncbi:hypothetical protein BTO06_06405 [Tenacibaculum sp. SZ-18]|uniref:LytR/AlgR family response regulator transcription factor n=1 Tax=Tenacibaculum sp. SZ-18 TaxID=754423 RepID=UPI000C2D3516|nr:LytTR family DNA-binding domain-containing protein [Tenacibaculum sp. SZ-18]AUC14796.1 hypothetical protein BTO06_06405 [Tenacibaculum sp. SZ-18]